MSVIIDHNGQQIIFVKGASEMVMSSCSDWYNPETDQIETISPQIKD